MNLPVPFTDYTRALMGSDVYDQLYVALQQEPPVSIRVNQQKSNGKEISFSTKVPWCDTGYYFDQRLTFTFDPLFHAGYYYVQEASSMFVEQVLKTYTTEKPVVMLDLCAAPGGKSTHARSQLPEGSLLVANEVMRNRSQILAENLTKWGHPDVVVTNNDPADFSRLGSFFDVILTDVPCSGEGMFRKDPVAIEEWSSENVEICWQRQRRIITDIWPCLKPGGILIYSTCTYNTKEDEENIRWMQQQFGATPLPVPAPAEWGVTGSLLSGEADLPVYRFLPHRTKGEGFFLAVVRKPETEEETFVEIDSVRSSRKKASAVRGKVTSQQVSKEQLSTAAGWLTDSKTYSVSAEGTAITAFPVNYANELSWLRQSLRIVSAGILLAEMKGKDLIPAHALAMSNLLNTTSFAMEELEYEQAIAYLRKEAIVLSPTTPKRYVLVCYKNTPLGFVKNIGNRANNLYPQEWRIRSGYLPEEIRCLNFTD